LPLRAPFDSFRHGPEKVEVKIEEGAAHETMRSDGVCKSINESIQLGR
jgi:hypothetical protein